MKFVVFYCTGKLVFVVKDQLKVTNNLQEYGNKPFARILLDGEV